MLEGLFIKVSQTNPVSIYLQNFDLVFIKHVIRKSESTEFS